MKNKIKGVLGVALTFMLLVSLTVGIVAPVSAADGSWSTLASPAAGATGKYLLCPTGGFGVGKGPGPMEKAIDGTLYAYWNIGEGATKSNLYKSADGARTWTTCSTATDDLGDVAIKVIACSTNDANRLYITDGTDIYRSTDAGATFVKLIPPGTGITCMDVGFNGGDYFIYVGRGVDVFMLRDAFATGWGSTGFAATFPGRNVVEVTCSPNFATEGQPQVIAVSYLNTGTPKAYVTYCYGGAAWGGDNEIQEKPGTSFAAAITAADIAFPDDYNSTPAAMEFFLGIATGGIEGDVYHIIASGDSPLNLRPAGTGTDITSVACAGRGGNWKLLAAGTSVRDVFHSEDSGATWTASVKDPAQTTGTTAKYIVMAGDYFTSGKAWIAVNAGEALDQASVAQTGIPTADFGASWTDVSMLNTDIKNITNMAVSPRYANDKTVFILTAPTGTGQSSLWRWDGTYWTRVFTAASPFAAVSSMVQCSPDYFMDEITKEPSKVVFLANTATGQMYRSTDKGFTFNPQGSPVPSFTGGMLVINSTTVIVGSDNKALITKNSGGSWLSVTPPGAVGPIASFAKSPDYATSKHLLCGDSGGRVFLSRDDGSSWSQIGTTVSGGVLMNVAFDSKYTGAAGGYAYAASGGKDRVYRLSVPAPPGLAPTTAWSTIDSPDTAGVVNEWPLHPGIQMAADGTLYVASQNAPGTTTGTDAAADAFRIVQNVVSTAAVTATGTSTVSAGVTVPADLTLNIDGTAITLACTDSTAILVATRIVTAINANAAASTTAANGGGISATIIFTAKAVGAAGNISPLPMTDGTFTGGTVPALNLTGGTNATYQVSTLTIGGAAFDAGDVYNVAIQGYGISETGHVAAATVANALASDITARPGLNALVTAVSDSVSVVTITAKTIGTAGAFTITASVVKTGASSATITPATTTALNQATASGNSTVTAGVTVPADLALNIDDTAITLACTDSTAILVATRIVTAINANAAASTTAANGGGTSATITFTAKVVGAAGNISPLPMTDGTFTGGTVPALNLTGGAAATGGDSGSITVTSGAISLAATTGTALVSINGGVTWVTSATATATGPAVVMWTTNALGASITVTCDTAPANGTWTATSVGLKTSAAKTVDLDGDAFVNNPSTLSPAASWSLPDKATSTQTPIGGNQVMLRSLTDTRTYSEKQNNGLTTGSLTGLRGLWLSDANTLWVLDSTGNRILTYTDRLTTAVASLTAPADKAALGTTITATLTWGTLTTASKFEIEVATTSTFTTASQATGSPFFSTSSPLVVSGLTPGTTYYWRVRSARVADGGRAMSLWSLTRSFSTTTPPLTGDEWNLFSNAGSVSPAPGAQGVGLRPSFQWNPAVGATGYEFELSDKADFSTTLASFKSDKALKSTVYAYDQDLEYSTAYYWRVRAISATSTSSWANGVFTTMAAPVAPTPPVTVTQVPAPQITIAAPAVEQITPMWIWAIIAIGAVLVIAVIVLIVTTRRVP